MVDPEEKKKRLDAEKDKSKSAEREREILARQQKEQRSRSTSYRLAKRIGLWKDDEEDTVQSPAHDPGDARPVGPEEQYHHHR